MFGFLDALDPDYCQDANDKGDCTDDYSGNYSGLDAVSRNGFDRDWW